MNHVSNLTLVSYLFLSSLVGAFNISVFACECESPSICVAYSEAEDVFVGKVKKIEQSKDEGIGTHKIHFEVEKVYKGDIRNNKIVNFSNSDCSPKFEQGKTYFVYKYKNNDGSTRFCNLSGRLKLSNRDIKYAESVGKSYGEYTLSGRIIGLSPEEALKTGISIKTDNKDQCVSIDRFGEFEFKTFDRGRAEVKIIIPFLTRNVYPDDILTATASGSSTLEFILYARPNECDFRQIQVQESDFKKN